MKLYIRYKGGAGSGNFNHAGRPGKIGGSGEGSISQIVTSHGHSMKFPELIRDIKSNIATGAYWISPNGDITKLQNMLHRESADKILDGIGLKRESAISASNDIVKMGLIRLHVERGGWGLDIPAKLTREQSDILSGIFIVKSPYTRVSSYKISDIGTTKFVGNNVTADMLL